MLRILSKHDYVSTPWNNGRGVTTDVLLLPEGAGRQDFDIRISLAPIDEEVPFSSFPGIDRHITLIEGHGLALDFGGTTRRLDPLTPLFFDSAAAPVSRLASGPVRVINVMTRRGRWTAEVAVWREAGDLLLGADELAIVHAIAGTWHAADGVALDAGDALLVQGPERVALRPQSATALVARFRPETAVG